MIAVANPIIVPFPVRRTGWRRIAEDAGVFALVDTPWVPKRPEPPKGGSDVGILYLDLQEESGAP